MSEQAIEVILADFVDAVRRRDLDTVRERLDPAVVHRGVAEHLICHDRDEVLSNVLDRMEHRDRRITRLEVTDAGDHVVLHMEGPDFTEIAGVPLEGSMSIVFTLRGGKIVEMQDYLHRQEALAAVGLSS